MSGKQGIKVLNVEDILKAPAQHGDGERGYRRGYHHGFFQALEYIERHGKKALYDLFAFSDNDILKWREDGLRTPDPGMKFPPQFKGKP